MTAIARFEVIPVRDGSMATDIARAVEALDQFDVSYETTATDTVIEADTVEQVLGAVQAAHAAIPGDRVITSVEIDEVRGRSQRAGDRVASVEQALGRPPRRGRESVRAQPPQQPQAQSQQQQPQFQQPQPQPQSQQQQPQPQFQQLQPQQQPQQPQPQAQPPRRYSGGQSQRTQPRPPTTPGGPSPTTGPQNTR